MKRASRVNAFLIEIVIVILFFGISSAVVLQLFVAAHQKSTESQRVNQAMIQLQAMAEQIKGLPDLTDQSLQSVSFCEGIQLGGGKADKTVPVNQDWEPVLGQAEVGYIRVHLQVQELAQGRMLRATLSAGERQGEQEGEAFYQLATQTYFPGSA